MTTKLNKTLREEILANVINATELGDREKDIRRRVAETVRQTLIKAQPKGFYDAIKNLPKEWFRNEMGAYIYMEGHPLGVLNGILNSNPYATGNGHHVGFDDPVTVAQAGWGVSNEKWATVLADLSKEAAAFAAQAIETRREIRAFLNSCTTVEKLLERMPELEPHVPKISKPMPLVAPSNLLSSLSQFGFDKTLKAA